MYDCICVYIYVYIHMYIHIYYVCICVDIMYMICSDNIMVILDNTGTMIYFAKKATMNFQCSTMLPIDTNWCMMFSSFMVNLEFGRMVR